MTRLFAYVGSRTSRERHARGEGISVYRVNGRGLERLQVLGGLVNPSFLAVNRAATRLYAVHGDEREASAFAIAGDGTLRHLNTVSCGGKNPVHLALDPAERFLVVSNHLSGALAVLEVRTDGSLGAVVRQVRLPGEPGPHRKEQPFSKPHFNPFEPSGRFVICPDKGLDRVFAFRFEDGALTPADSPWVDSREGAGPRHVAFHPAAPFAYCVNELDSTVTTCAFDAASGRLSPLQILPTLPSEFIGNSRAAEIEVDARGRFVYASNRGHDSIAAFRVDASSGLLQWVGCTLSGGRTPRFFALAPDGATLFALNEDSDTIATFELPPDGVPLPAGDAVACGSPVCMVFAKR